MVESFSANVILAAHINKVAGERGIPSVQLSTGGLDKNPLSLEIENKLRHIIPDTGWREKNDHQNAAIALGELTGTHNYYDISKRVMELSTFSSLNATAVRVSNTLGPGLSAATLVPRLIDGMLRGRSLSVENEARNWSTIEQLSIFLLNIATGNIRHEHLMWAYGDYNLSVQQLVRHLREILPLAYGTVSVSSTKVMQDNLGIPRIRDYIDSPPPLPLTTVLWSVARAVRVNQKYESFDFVTEPKELSNADTSTLGGSIAHKEHSQALITKTCGPLGYEGAGRAKICAEGAFYRWLAQSAHPKLAALYPRFETDVSTPETAGFTLERIALGVTVAASISSGAAISPDSIEDVVGELFTWSYLSDLESIPLSMRKDLLNSLYLTRATDRLRNFIGLTQSSLHDGDLLDFSTILNGSETVSINGRIHRNPLVILDLLSNYVNNFDKLDPLTWGTCGHGDLTLLNMIAESPLNIRLIDPRGYIGRLDPVYDLAKLYFSITGFSSVLGGGTTSCRVAKNEFQLSHGPAQARFDQYSTWFWADLIDGQVLGVLRDQEPYMRLRIEFAAACHYLSDAVYRYAQGRNEMSTLSVLLLGTEALDNFYEKLLGTMD